MAEKGQVSYGSVEPLTVSIGGSTNHPHDFIAYPQRWLVLLAFSLLSWINSWIWITWSPIVPELAKFWSVEASLVDGLSAVYMYVYIPFSFPALSFLHRYKLRWGLLMGGSLNCFGALIRYLGFGSYPWAYLGTFLCATAQTLTLAMPPLISTLWFQENERGLSTSLGVLANQLGIAFGLGVTIFIKFSASDENGDDSAPSLIVGNFRFYLWLQMILSGISLALIAGCVRTSVPPTPPSEAASSQKQTTYFESIRLLVGRISGVFLCIVYGLVVGVMYTIATFLSQLFMRNDSTATESEEQEHASWSNKETGYLGLVFILAGVIGNLVSGEFLDKTHSYRGLTIGLLLGSIISMLAFLLSFELLPWNRFLAYTTISLLGFFLTGFVSVGFEYGAAISYPADEAAAAGVLNVAAQLGGWVLVLIGGRMGSVGTMLNIVLLATLLIAFVLMMLFVREKSSRPV